MVAASTSVDLAEEVGRDYITTAHVVMTQNWLRVSSCTQHYSLVGHRLSSLMLVGKIGLRVNYTFVAFAAKSGTCVMKRQLRHSCLHLSSGQWTS